ncbi:MAG: hypothetical protein EXQ98_07195 [Alphaproteobacteria bacterium]|nr:hypothetical protein [Alphaproteobacteria bacterium]
MTKIDGPLLSAQASAQYGLELNEARAEALAAMVRGYLDGARGATKALPMDAEPALFPATLQALAKGAKS